MSVILTPIHENRWEPIDSLPVASAASIGAIDRARRSPEEALAERNEGIVELTEADQEASRALWDDRYTAIDLAWDESDHPRAGKGAQGGGRFVAKSGGDQAMSGHRRVERSGARKALRELGGFDRSGASRAIRADRKDRTGETETVRRWNRLSGQKRRRKMREFLTLGQKLPDGWSFRNDGSISVGVDLSVSEGAVHATSEAAGDSIDIEYERASDADLEASRAFWGGCE